MLSLTSQYALRALIHLARNEQDWPIPGRSIAESTRVPPKYLSKVLGDLVRKGILASSPGKMGGFSLRRPAGKTTLLDVLSTFEQFERRTCPFGNKECNERDPCLAHHQWKKVIDAERKFLQRTTIYEVAINKKTVKKKRRRPAARATKR